METQRTSELCAQAKRFEEQGAALGGQMERCWNERGRVLATLGRLNDNQNRGAEFCSSSCFMIMLCAGSVKSQVWSCAVTEFESVATTAAKRM